MSEQLLYSVLVLWQNKTTQKSNAQAQTEIIIMKMAWHSLLVETVSDRKRIIA